MCTDVLHTRFTTISALQLVGSFQTKLVTPTMNIVTVSTAVQSIDSLGLAMPGAVAGEAAAEHRAILQQVMCHGLNILLFN